MPTGPQPTSSVTWFKSSYSGGNTTECVEAAFAPRGVLIRDSKRPADQRLTVSPGAWTEFVAGLPLSPE
jgi:hypothetical protein